MSSSLATLAILAFILINPAYQEFYTLSKEFYTNYFSDDDIIGGSNPWVLGGSNIPPFKLFTICNNSRIFGGYKVFSGHETLPSSATKTWTNLPPHFSLTISMKVYKIDSWGSESMFIMVDGISRAILTWNESTGATDVCGNPNPSPSPHNPQYNEYVETLIITVPHVASSMTLKLTSNLNSWTGSWGIRELTVNLSRCSMSCLNCFNETQCLSCDTAKGLSLVGQFCECSVGWRRLILSNCGVTECVSCINTACPSGYYLNTIVNNCEECHKACSVCIGPSILPSNCTTCNSAGFINNGSGNCVQCYGFCNGCIGLGSTQCTSCMGGYFLYGNTCVTECPLDYYSVESTKMCIACLAPCYFCFGSTANHCLSCSLGWFLLESTCYNPCPNGMYGFNGSCMSACPLGTYPDITPICLLCPNFCETCDQIGNCTTCLISAYFNPIDNKCYNPCPNMYYGDTVTHICTHCDSSCQTCSGPSSSECLSCYPLTYLVYSSCYSTNACPAHTYSSTCKLCDDACFNCTGPTSKDCTSCGKYLLFHVNLTSCLEQCLDGDVIDNQGGKCWTCPIGKVGQLGECTACSPSCLSCSGKSFHECLTCVSISILSENLTVNFGEQLSNKIVLFGKNTCIHVNSPIIYMPNETNTSSSIYNGLFYVILINVCVCFALEFIFKYKTNLLVTIETMQILSYFYYFSIPFSESNQIAFFFLNHAHPTSIISIHNLLPMLNDFANLNGHANTEDIMTKALLMGKTGIFLVDTFYLHICFCLSLMLFAFFKITDMYFGLYQKFNPYLIGYTMRILFMELFFNGVLFFSYVNLDSPVMKGSLALLIIDILAITLSLFWKVRTELEQDHAHFALFYFNELGPRRIHSQYQELTARQIKQKKSILPSLIYFIGRLPIIATIFLFINEPLTQSICILIYSSFLLGVNITLEYRRRIYRFLVLFSYFSLVISSVFMVMLSCGINAAVGLDIWIFSTFFVFLCCTFGQIMTNYQFFMSIYDYVLVKYFGHQKIND